eukprot:10499819-Lingulodinium_polyedra.AAC.1
MDPELLANATYWSAADAHALTVPMLARRLGRALEGEKPRTQATEGARIALLRAGVAVEEGGRAELTQEAAARYEETPWQGDTPAEQLGAGAPTAPTGGRRGGGGEEVEPPPS